jgi:flagellar M-ring protein FliF
MEFIKSQFVRIRQQLAALTPSQKMLCGALVVIMLMTLFFWTRYAGQPEWEAVLDQPLSQEELGRIQMQLAGAGIEHKLAPDGKLLVPADRKVQAIATLAYSGATPKNIASGFDEMIKQLTAWDGQDRQSAIFNRGKELSLERVISAMPGVAAANVFIDPHYDRMIGRNIIEPTATVNVMMRDSSPTAASKPLATAIATLVSGAQSGLAMNKVKVIINGHAAKIQDSSAPGGQISIDGISDIQLAAEQNYAGKIEHQLSYIEGLRVSVTVKVNTVTEEKEHLKFNKDESSHMEKSTTSRAREDSASPAQANESGVLPNVGTAVAGNNASPSRQNTDTIDTMLYDNQPGREQTKTIKPAGEASPVGVSVRIPRSFFSRVAKQRDPQRKEPDNAAIEKCIAEEIGSIQSTVKSCTAIKDPEFITVAAYSDLLPLDERATPVVAAGTLTGMLSGHVKEVALGALALVSLFMMSMIVRKGAPAPVPVTVAAAPTPITPPIGSAANPLEVGEKLAGEVGESNATLDGMELDEDSIKSQQMLTQVTELVGENPDVAASLIKRWMNNR